MSSGSMTAGRTAALPGMTLWVTDVQRLSTDALDVAPAAAGLAGRPLAAEPLQHDASKERRARKCEEKIISVLMRRRRARCSKPANPVTATGSAGQTNKHTHTCTLMMHCYEQT